MSCEVHLSAKNPDDKYSIGSYTIKKDMGLVSVDCLIFHYYKWLSQFRIEG
jgi:hypothetical protein